MASARKRMDTKRQEAETLAGQLAFESALMLAREIAATMDERLKHQNDWSEAFIKETEAEHSRQLASAESHLDEARKHRQAIDYSAAMHSIQSIPEPMRTEEIKSFDLAVKNDREELQALLGMIRERIKTKAVDGLLELVHRVLELDGNRQDLQKVRQQLIEREEKLKQQTLLKQPLVNSIGMQFKLLPLGSFTMGDGSDSHQVKLTKPFYVGVTQVTQSQFERVMGRNPSCFSGAQRPVDQVSWDCAVEFCSRLSVLPAEKAARRVYRLPTEAEWEYACRAGTTTKYSFGDDANNLGDYAWFDVNSGDSTHPVGLKKPNAWGFYDMHGNVWEWCADWYDDLTKWPVSDPVGPPTGTLRVNRGGSWSVWPADCRSMIRNKYNPSFSHRGLGFRVALVFRETHN